MTEDSDFTPKQEFMDRPATRAELWRAVYRQSRVNIALVDALMAATDGDKNLVKSALDEFLKRTQEMTDYVDLLVQQERQEDE